MNLSSFGKKYIFEEISQKMKTSLLISTYNWPEALDLVLSSAINQKIQADEILIADDGSTEETKALIDSFKSKSIVPIRHFWHEDNGFRKAIILNKAIAGATGNYIVQIDGDCIMHKSFVGDHIAMAKENTYLYGSRVNIQEDYLTELFKNRKLQFGFFDEGIKKRTRNLRIPLLSRMYGRHKEVSKKMRGCNVSFWKKDVLAVNGYNEEFVGWGREDSELILRMINNGVLGQRLRYRGIVYHIWHKVKDKSGFKRNDAIQEKTIVEKSTWCKKGIDAYL